MTDKDRGTEPQPNEILPAEENLEESQEDLVDADEEFEEEPQAAAAAAPAERGRTGRTPTAAERRQLGSLRGSHERVHIDDRLSALFAVLAAIALVGVLILPWIGGYIPTPAGPTLTPLVLPTYHATPAPAATPSASVAPTATPSASASAQ